MTSIHCLQLPLQRLRKTAVAIAAIMALFLRFACAAPPSLVRPDAAHPLQGKIWDVSRGRMVPKEHC